MVLLAMVLLAMVAMMLLAMVAVAAGAGGRAAKPVIRAMLSGSAAGQAVAALSRQAPAGWQGAVALALAESCNVWQASMWHVCGM